MKSVFAQIESSEKDTIQIIDIKEVIIKSQKKKQFSDHANYSFDKKDLEKARYSKDLLLTLPELQHDPISDRIVSIKGGRLLFLVNGVEVSDNQLKSISSTNVIRVEYFDIPPAKYSQRADIVVNIITRNPEIGYSFGADILSSFTTGFINGSAYSGYTKGKNDFGFEYYINYRDYDNRIVNKTYEYDLNNFHYRSIEKQKDNFGYINQNIGLRYANASIGKYVFQSKINLALNSSSMKGIGQSVFLINEDESLHKTIHNNNSNYINPTLDLYYSKNIGKNDELSINLIGSYYKTNSYQFDKEWIGYGDIDVFNNEMDLKAKQTGLVGEFIYSHKIRNGKINSGYRISNTSIDNDLINLLGDSKYSVNYLEQYLYSEYSARKDKFSYRFSIGITNINNKNSENVQSIWVPTPKVVLSYDLPKSQSIRFVTQYTSQSPFASALSSNITQDAPNIFQKGNPYLKTQHFFKNNIIYSFNNRYFDLNATIFYNIVDKYFAQFYQLDTEIGGYALTYENAKKYNEKGAQISGSIKPFGSNIFVVKTYLSPTSMELVSKDGVKFQSNFIRNNFTLMSQYNDFTFYYQFNLPIYTLSGSFLSKDENQHHAFLYYKKENLTIYSGMYWIGISSKYSTKSLTGSQVEFNKDTNIYNNKNMFILGISYNFFSGKKIQIDKKIKNDIAPATIF